MERNFLIFIAILFIIKNIVTSTQYNNQEIILKIKEKGYQHILTTDPERDKTNTCPDILYINEIENNKINKCGPIYLNEKNSTIKMIWYDKILYYRMFKDLVNITEVDLSNFDTSLYDNFNMMFQNCISLTSINFGNKERTSTLNENNLNSMFYNCKSLISINLSTFKKLKITSMGYVFFNCISLKYVNLSGIDTSNVKAMDNMFNNCTSLTSIDMSNLDTSSVTNMDSIFIINENCVNISCELNWKHYQKKIINPFRNDCVEKCGEKYEYDNQCLNDCPDNYKPNIYNICEPIIISTTETIKKNIITDMITDKNLINNNTKIIDNNNKSSCDIINFFLKKCNNEFKTEEEKYIFKNSIINSIKNNTFKGILLDILNNGTNYIIKEGKEIYQISLLLNQLDIDNITSINFYNCLEILKSNNIIINEEELFIFKIEHEKSGYKIPLIEYILFNINGSIINLDFCANIYSQYFIPVDDINTQKLFLYNTSSEFYNDECNKYKTENDTDMTIYDRKKNFNDNNLSLCEVNCIYKGYNFTTTKVECECLTKSYLYSTNDLTGDNLLNKLNNEEKKTNLNLMKCGDLLTATENIKNNTGFFLLGLIIALFIIVMIIFCVRGYNNLENKIDEVISIKFGNKRTNKNKSKTSIHDIIHNNIIKKGRKNNKSNSLRHKSNKTNKNISSMNISNKSFGKKNSEIINKDKDNNKEDEDFMKCTNDYEMNNLSYEFALKYDKREFCEYYFSLIRTKQLIFFSFCDFNDYNSGIVKKFIFFLSFALHYTINALFFTDKLMHQIYQDEGKYNISYQFPYIIYSSIISTIILRIILVTLVLTEKSVLEVKKQINKILAYKKKKEVLKYVIIKFSIFFILNLILLIIFWYYLTCFNAVYENTQIDLIINAIISFGISCVYPFVINIIPSIFRMDSLDNKNNKKRKNAKNAKNKKINKNKEYVYKISKYLQLL